jgi:hypothetical protein
MDELSVLSPWQRSGQDSGSKDERKKAGELHIWQRNIGTLGDEENSQPNVLGFLSQKLIRSQPVLLGQMRRGGDESRIHSYISDILCILVT